jgi:hypothetical protein
MLPHDEDAKRLSRQTLTLGEFLAQHAADWEMPRLERKAVVHFHCHQRATSDTDCDVEVLDRLGLDYEVLDAGCCGLAGSFGYERGERYEVSIKAGEKALLPRVRDVSEHTLILTDGFSCHSQIDHGSDRQALHLAQAIQMALHEGPNGPATPRPERHYVQAPDVKHSGSALPARAAGTAAMAIGGLALLTRHRRTASGPTPASLTSRE